MLHFSRLKTILVLASVLLALLLALPNALPAAWQKTISDYTIARPITLGLDLQGGSNVLMEVDRADLRNQLLLQMTGDIRGALREAKIGYKGINRSENGVTVRISEP